MSRAVLRALFGIRLYPILAVVAIIDVHALFHERLGGWIWLVDIVGAIIALLLWPFSRPYGVSPPPAIASGQSVADEDSPARDDTTEGRAGERVQEARPEPHVDRDETEWDSEAEPCGTASLWDDWFYGAFLGDVLPVSLALASTEGAIVLVADHPSPAVRVAPLLLLTVYCAYRLFMRLGFLALLAPIVLEFDAKQDEPWAYWVGSMVTYLALMTALFGGWTAFWRTLGYVGAGGSIDDANVVLQSNLLFVWHFLDSIPLLEIPQTVHWAVPTGFDDWRGGILILVYRILVILPLIAGAFALYRALWNKVGQANVNDRGGM